MGPLLDSPIQLWILWSLWDDSTWRVLPKCFQISRPSLKFLLLSDVEKHSQTLPVGWLCGSPGDVCVSVGKSELKSPGCDLCAQAWSVLRHRHGLSLNPPVVGVRICAQESTVEGK